MHWGVADRVQKTRRRNQIPTDSAALVGAPAFLFFSISSSWPWAVLLLVLRSLVVSPSGLSACNNSRQTYGQSSGPDGARHEQAVMAAVRQKVHIISMSWTVQETDDIRRASSSPAKCGYMHSEAEAKHGGNNPLTDVQAAKFTHLQRPGYSFDTTIVSRASRSRSPPPPGRMSRNLYKIGLDGLPSPLTKPSFSPSAQLSPTIIC